MIGRTTGRILGWLEQRCAGHQLRAGSRQRERLLRKMGWASETTPAHRLPSGARRIHGEAVYRRFKWDPSQVPAAARALCRELVALETRQSHLVRRIGSGPDTAAPPHPPAPSSAWALRVAGRRYSGAMR